jgi:hypothetical protein
MFGFSNGSPQQEYSVQELQALLAARAAENADLQEQLRAHRESDQRDFLNDNSDQLTSVINTKNMVIQELQAQLQTQGAGEGLAQALHAASLSAAEVERLRKTADGLQTELEAAQSQVAQLQAAATAPVVTPPLATPDHEAAEQQLELYKAENQRQAQQIASSAASHAMEAARLQAMLKATSAAAALPPAASSGSATADGEQRALRAEAALQVANERVDALDAQLQATAAIAAESQKLQASLQSANERIAALEAQLQTATTASTEATLHATAASEAKERVAALEAQLQTATAAGAECQTLQATLQSANERIAALEAQLQIATAASTEASLHATAASEANERVAALEAQLQAAAAAGAESHALQAKLHATAASEANERVAVLEAKLQAATAAGSESQTLQARVHELESEMIASQAKQGAMVSSLQASLQEEKDRVLSLEQQLRSATATSPVSTEAAFATGARVRIKEEVKDVFGRPIAQGLVGEVQTINQVGDAEILFDEVLHVVNKRDLTQLEVIQAAPEEIIVPIVRDSSGAAGFAFKDKDLSITSIQSADIVLLRSGDIIIAVNGVPVKTKAEYLREAKGVPRFEMTVRRSIAQAPLVSSAQFYSIADEDEAGQAAKFNEAVLARKADEQTISALRAELEKLRSVPTSVSERESTNVTREAEKTHSRVQQLESALAAERKQNKERDDAAQAKLAELSSDLSRSCAHIADLESRLELASVAAPAPAEAVGKAVAQNGEEVRSLQALLATKDKDVEASRTEAAEARCKVQIASDEAAEARRSVHDLTSKVQVLEAKLLRARGEAQLAEQRAAGVTAAVAKGDVSSPLTGLGSGNLQSMIVGALQDVEMGERSCVTVSDLGLGDVAGLKDIDGFLRLLSALMAVRADARLGVFGLWAICHSIYVIYLIYEHFIRRF